MRTIALVLAAAALLSGAGAGVACAQDPPAASAARRVAAAQKLFDKGQFAQAAAEYEAAYAIGRDPTLHRRLGETWERAGEPRRAVDAYRRYVAELPQAPDRTPIERRILELQQKHHLPAPPPEPITPPPAPSTGPAGAAPTPLPPPAAAGQPTGSLEGAPALPGRTDVTPPGTVPPGAETPHLVPPPAPVPPPPPPPGALADDDHPSKLRLAAWVTTAATVVLLASGAIVGLAAQERADEISREQAVLQDGKPIQFSHDLDVKFQNLYSEGRMLDGLAIGLLAGAGAAAVASVALFIAEHRRAARERPAAARVELVPSLGATGGSLGARLAF